MDYRFALDIEPDNQKLELCANINMKEFKKDIPRIMAKDKDFIQIVIRAAIASKVFRDEPKRYLQMIENDFKIVAEARDGVFHYKRSGTYRDAIMCLAITFGMQPQIRDISLELVEEYIPGVCPCDDCTEKRKAGEDSPENVKHAMDEIINHYKENNPGSN